VIAMVKKVSDFLKKRDQEGLKLCTPGNVHMFKRCFSHTDLGGDISDVVDAIPDESLEAALGLVERTIKGRSA
jgi:hypothetical protein